jgi:hypothetical protein
MCIDSPVVIPPSCPTGYSHEPTLDLCYKYVPSPTTDAITASVDCVNSGGTLMAASSDARNSFIANTLGNGNTRLWIGLTLNLVTSSYEWYCYS